MLKKFLFGIIGAVCVIFVLSGCSPQNNNPSNIPKFKVSDFSEKYQNTEYADYIEAVCGYYNELIILCDELQENDYSTLLTSDKLDQYSDLIQSESDVLKAKLTDKEALRDIVDIDVSISSTAYLVATYNTENFFVAQDDDTINFDAEVDISAFNDVVESIEAMRTKLTQ